MAEIAKYGWVLGMTALWSSSMSIAIFMDPKVKIDIQISFSALSKPLMILSLFFPFFIQMYVDLLSIRIWAFFFLPVTFIFVIDGSHLLWALLSMFLVKSIEKKCQINISNGMEIGWNSSVCNVIYVCQVIAEFGYKVTNWVLYLDLWIYL